MKWIRSVTLFAAGIAVGAVLTQSTAAQQNRSTGHRINHVGITVTNFDESLKFYTQVMGFKEAYRFPSQNGQPSTCLLYTSDAADERSSVDLGGRRIIKKKKTR